MSGVRARSKPTGVHLARCSATGARKVGDRDPGTGRCAAPGPPGRSHLQSSSPVVEPAPDGRRPPAMRDADRRLPLPEASGKGSSTPARSAPPPGGPLGSGAGPDPRGRITHVVFVPPCPAAPHAGQHRGSDPARRTGDRPGPHRRAARRGASRVLVGRLVERLLDRRGLPALPEPRCTPTTRSSGCASRAAAALPPCPTAPGRPSGSCAAAIPRAISSCTTPPTRSRRGRPPRTSTSRARCPPAAGGTGEPTPRTSGGKVVEVGEGVMRTVIGIPPGRAQRCDAHKR